MKQLCQITHFVNNLQFLGFLTNYISVSIFISISFPPVVWPNVISYLLFHILQTILKVIIHLIVTRHCILLQEVLIHRQKKKKKNPKAQEDGFPLIHGRDESTQIQLYVDRQSHTHPTYKDKITYSQNLKDVTQSSILLEIKNWNLWMDFAKQHSDLWMPDK